MARQYGNQTGAYQDSSLSEAGGSWISPTEIIRNKTLNRWPFVQLVPDIFAGTYVYSIASGISNNLVVNGIFYVADGSEKNRTDVELFQALGTTYGSGNGSNTFNIPNLSTRPYTFLKSTTVSGLSLASLSGVGVIPSHTHSVTGTTSSTSANTAGGGGGSVVNTQVSNTLFTSSDGGDDGNTPRRREAQILIAKTTTTAPIGVVFPQLLPLDQLTFNSQLSSSFLIPSGQDISRTNYNTLFRYIGIKFGSGNGVNTFTLPDLRGLFLSGYPTIIPDSSGVLPSGYMIDVFAKHRHLANLRTPLAAFGDFGTAGSHGNTMSAPATGISSIAGVETRPANISVIWILVAQ